MHLIAPLVLAADFGRLGEEVRRVELGGADLIHIDVMDGHFVPNLSMGPATVKALRRATRLPLNVHLMITDPARFLEPFAQAGADLISVHVEANDDPRERIRWLHDRRIGAGVALNPETPAARVLDLAPLVDMMLVMTVHPGFGGQSFIPEMLQKIAAIRAACPGLDIAVDGGIGPENLEKVARAGANLFIAGSSVFGRPDPAEAIREFREILSAVEGPAGAAREKEDP